MKKASDLHNEWMKSPTYRAEYEKQQKEITMKPTIGRIVHYVLTQWDADRINEQPTSFERDESKEGDELAAVVCGVHEDGTLNIQVLGFRALHWTPTLSEDQELKKAPGSWHWPEREV
jgi:hypothetical protein